VEVDDLPLDARHLRLRRWRWLVGLGGALDPLLQLLALTRRLSSL
jgi:hypothetical protein